MAILWICIWNGGVLSLMWRSMVGEFYSHMVHGMRGTSKFLFLINIQLIQGDEKTSWEVTGVFSNL